jgi:uncharacterized protein (UPF0335 family)
MAEFEKPGFKFPDEGTEIVAREGEEKDDVKIEIEIEDDRPEQDRVDPLPENVKEELYDDEMTDYSAKVKKKLLQMKKLAHDERREKDAAMREQQEALAFAQQVIEENKRLKSHLNENEKSILQSVSKNVEMEMEQAKRSYREAYESGDTEKMLEAQQKLTDVALKQEKVKNFKPTPLQIETPVVQTRQEAVTPRADPSAVAWQQENSWFGQDKLMTGMALALHEQLKDEGVVLSSQEYYRRIDETMRQRFPEKFETDRQNQNEYSRTRPSTNVAPATRSTAPKKIRLTQSQLAISKKLGLSPEQYAQAVLKMES